MNFTFQDLMSFGMFIIGMLTLILLIIRDIKK